MVNSTARPNIGGHVSAAGGFHKALERGESIGAEVIQIFVSSPRSWSVSMPSAETLEKYWDYRKKSVIKDVYVHGSYLVNLGTSRPDLFKKSFKNITDEFKIANQIGAKAFIFHIGSKNGNSNWLRQVVSAIQNVLKEISGPTFLALENSAGGGEKIGGRLEEFKEIIDSIGSERVRVCIDTAHSFESGLIPEYSPAVIKKILADIENNIGLSKIIALHINDSKTKMGSFNDRHENIGQGYIGLSGFRSLAKERSLWHADWLLEVPGFDNQGPDRKNINIVRSLFE